MTPLFPSIKWQILKYLYCDELNYNSFEFLSYYVIYDISRNLQIHINQRVTFLNTSKVATFPSGCEGAAEAERTDYKSSFCLRSVLFPSTGVTVHSQVSLADVLTSQHGYKAQRHLRFTHCSHDTASLSARLCGRPGHRCWYVVILSNNFYFCFKFRPQ